MDRAEVLEQMAPILGTTAKAVDHGPGTRVLVADSEVVVMKRPSLLHLRFARPELRQEMEEAWQHFRKIRNPQRWSYVVDYLNGHKGWLTNSLPTFWSDDLSRAFASVDLGGTESTARRRNGARARSSKEDGKR